MPRPVTRTQAQELALPVASLMALRHALANEVGADAAARALRGAGHAAGDALLLPLRERASEDEALGDISETAFWRRLTELFATRGWGHLEHHHLHEGVGMLESPDWVEADPAFAAGRPSCFFTTGLLANILGGAAGAEVAVLEAECRSRGDLRCRFVFGAPDTLNAVHAAARGGAALESALATLG